MGRHHCRTIPHERVQPKIERGNAEHLVNESRYQREGAFRARVGLPQHTPPSCVYTATHASKVWIPCTHTHVCTRIITHMHTCDFSNASFVFEKRPPAASAFLSPASLPSSSRSCSASASSCRKQAASSGGKVDFFNTACCRRSTYLRPAQ